MVSNNGIEILASSNLQKNRQIIDLYYKMSPKSVRNSKNFVKTTHFQFYWKLSD